MIGRKTADEVKSILLDACKCWKIRPIDMVLLLKELEKVDGGDEPVEFRLPLCDMTSYRDTIGLLLAVLQEKI